MKLTINRAEFVRRLPVIISVLALLISSTPLLTRVKQLQTVVVDSEVIIKKLSQKLATRRGRVSSQHMAKAVAALKVKLAEYAKSHGKILLAKRSVLTVSAA